MLTHSPSPHLRPHLGHLPISHPPLPLLCSSTTGPALASSQRRRRPDPLRQRIRAGGMECPDPKRSVATVAGLPDDALLEILSRLPVKPLCRSKCVSKGWRDLIADPLHRKKLPQTLEGFFYGGGDVHTDEDDGDVHADDGDVHADEDDGDVHADEEDGDDPRDDGSDNDPRKRRGYGHFINLFGAPAVPIVDPSFPFLKELADVPSISLVGSCNGLLLFEHEVEPGTMGNIVSNPATEQLVTIPVHCTQPPKYVYQCSRTSLIFDPAISSHFHIVKFWQNADMLMYIYSSETGAWTSRICDCAWRSVDLHVVPDLVGAFVNGMLHVVMMNWTKDVIFVVDVERDRKDIIRGPYQLGQENYWGHWDQEVYLEISDYVGQSQGRLHCICHVEDMSAEDGPSEMFDYKEGSINELLFIWVLEDYDAERWVLKHTVTFFKLFGKKGNFQGESYHVAAIHPDHNLVFFVHIWDQKLISYNMDSGEVRDLCTLPHDYGSITPYVPCFLEWPPLGNKH